MIMMSNFICLTNNVTSNINIWSYRVIFNQLFKLDKKNKFLNR